MSTSSVVINVCMCGQEEGEKRAVRGRQGN
jgi:hypothetical protein